MASPSTSKASPVMPRAPPVQSPRKHQGSPQIIAADAEDFSRRLNTSSSKRPAHTSPRTAHSSAKNNKLPQTDSTPMRYTAEPKSISDATGSSYAPRGMSINPSGPLREASAHQRQLFDHRKDDPVRFSVLARPSSTNGNRPVPTQIFSRLRLAILFIILRTLPGVL
jgi:protein SMG6